MSLLTNVFLVLFYFFLQTLKVYTEKSRPNDGLKESIRQ
jgi:hypothetical protein